MNPPDFRNHPLFNPNIDLDDFYNSCKDIVRDGVTISVCKHDLEHCNTCFIDNRPFNNIARSEAGKKEEKKVKKVLKKVGCGFPDCPEEEKAKLKYCTSCMLVAYW